MEEEKENYSTYPEENKKEIAPNNFKKVISNIFKVIFGLFSILIIFGFILYLWGLYEKNIRYSVAMPKILGYFRKYDDFISVEGLWTISTKEKDEGEKSASLLYGNFSCYYKFGYCKEETVSISNFDGQINIFPHVYKYDITYRDKNRILFTDEEKVSGVVDLNQETITKTITKTFLRETPKVQTDEFITDNSEILKEQKRITRKYLKQKIFGKF